MATLRRKKQQNQRPKSWRDSFMELLGEFGGSKASAETSLMPLMGSGAAGFPGWGTPPGRLNGRRVGMPSTSSGGEDPPGGSLVENMQRKPFSSSGRGSSRPNKSYYPVPDASPSLRSPPQPRSHLLSQSARAGRSNRRNWTRLSWAEEWLCREIQETLLRRNEGMKSLVLHGCSGSGKTTFLRHLAASSLFHSPPGISSGNIQGSRPSLTSQNLLTTAPPATLLKWVSERVVGYHLCRVEYAETCSVPDFLVNLAAPLATSPLLLIGWLMTSPLLTPYANWLAGHAEIQEKLELPAALHIHPFELFRTCILEPLKALKIKPDAPLLILVGGIDEAEFHRPESTDSLASFLAKTAHLLPSYLTLVLSIRWERQALVEELSERGAVSLDDVGLDERCWRDALSYAHARLQAAPALGSALRRAGISLFI